VTLRSIPETIPLVFASLILPIDFISQVDGYLKYMGWREVAIVYAWAWLFYFVAGCTIAFPVFVILWAPPFRGKPLAAKLALYGVNCLTMATIGLAILRDTKLWFSKIGFDVSAFWLGGHQRSVIIGVGFLAGAASWKFTQGAEIFLKRAAALGLFVPLALLASLALSSPSGGPIQSQVAPAPPASAQADSRPDIVLITLDAFPANHSPIYNYALNTTPNLKALANEAFVFDRFYANSNFTTPCINSLINGVRPWTHRANQSWAQVSEAVSENGLIANLRRAGYNTMSVSTNVLAAPFHNQNQCWFDQRSYGNVHDSFALLASFVGSHFTHFNPISSLSLVESSAAICDRALVISGIWSSTDEFDPNFALSKARGLWDARPKDRPAFLWVHLFPPHSPYAAPVPFVGRFDARPGHRSRFDSTPPWNFFAAKDPQFPDAYQGRFDESLLWVDDRVGRFLNWLRAGTRFSDMLLIVSADHGESFSNRYSGHGGPMLTEDLIHIPLIMKLPHQQHGARCDGLAEQIDLVPTILDIAGVAARDPTEGRSLKLALSGGPGDSAIYSMSLEENGRFGPLRNGSVAMIEANWKYVHYFGSLLESDAHPLSDALYDLSVDAHAAKNVAFEHSQIADEMRASIVQHLQAHHSVDE